jgi:hypothetical protein
LPRSTQFIMSHLAPRPHCTMLPRPTFNNVVDASLLHLLPRPFTTYSKNDVPRRGSDMGESREERLAATLCLPPLLSKDIDRLYPRAATFPEWELSTCWACCLG